MLKPLKLIFSYSIFENPTNYNYALAGSEKARVFLLNDFRWSKEMIPWHDMVVLLEGETVKLPAPINIYSEGIVISTVVTNLQQPRAQSYTEAVTMQVMTERQRWSLPDGKTISFVPSIFSTRAEGSASLSKIFAKLVLFE